MEVLGLAHTIAEDALRAEPIIWASIVADSLLILLSHCSIRHLASRVLGCERRSESEKF